MNSFSFSHLPYSLGQVSYLDLEPPAYRAAPAPGPPPHLFDPAARAASAHSPAADTLRFVLCQASSSAAKLHLALFCREQQLAHWVLRVLPDAALPEPALPLPCYLVEAPESLPLPTRLIDQGSCGLKNEPANQRVMAQLTEELRAGYLQLTISGHQLQGIFSLERLPDQSHTWKLDRSRFLSSHRL